MKNYSILITTETFLKIPVTSKDEAERLARERVQECLDNNGFCAEVLSADGVRETTLNKWGG